MTDINQVVMPSPESWSFIEQLRTPAKRYFAWPRQEKRNHEVDLRNGVMLFNEFSDPGKRIETAVDDWLDFLKIGGLPAAGPVDLRLVHGESGPFDSFSIKISENSIKIIACQLEGIRRGIFYLEDLLLAADGPFLPFGETHRNAWLKNRISRCFFGPIKRPPMNRDELIDDVDYYPEAYLNRLAHEGINGLWLTIELKDICRTEITPDAAPDAEKRLAKLKKTVENCLRYGIRTFLFMIEPISWNVDDPILKKYPELGGAIAADGRICFCPSSETAQKYLYQSTNYIFRRIPELGGIINISLGERTTTCLSSIGWANDNKMMNAEMKCPRCVQHPLRDVIYKSVSSMTKGMRDASPNAEFICWYYCSNSTDMRDDFFDLTHLPEGTTLLFNFESGGRQTQCGKELIGGDYWLSYVGPSERFTHLMDNVPDEIGRGAKLQVACSHELATVPYIPVPGLLYRKYKQMHRLNVTTAMQCWYFGNYPGLMNKAAGMLAFEDFTTDETDFLKRLAAPIWGSDSESFAKIWKLTSDAYQNYPFSNLIQYYGPFHDGIVWPLYPTYQYLPLYPTWRSDYPVSGDTIGECLFDLSLEHAESLSGKIASMWHDAVEKAEVVQKKYINAPEQFAEIDLMKSLDILFTAAHDIYRFYLLRSEGKGFTPEMRSIIEQEIQLSERMKELCQKDSRLGFHSEAENYKFYPQKLDLRKRFLEEMLQSQPQEVQIVPLDITEKWYKADGYSWRMSDEDSSLRIYVVMHSTYRVDQIFAAIQGKPEIPPVVIGVTKENRPIQIPHGATLKAWADGDTWHAEFSIPWKCIQLCNETFRFALTRLFVSRNELEYTPYPRQPDKVVFRMGIGYHRPQYMLTFHK